MFYITISIRCTDMEIQVETTLQGKWQPRNQVQWPWLHIHWCKKVSHTRLGKIPLHIYHVCLHQVQIRLSSLTLKSETGASVAQKMDMHPIKIFTKKMMKIQHSEVIKGPKWVQNLKAHPKVHVPYYHSLS